MKCTLNSEINKCPFFIQEENGCRNDKECSFQYNDEQETKKEDYVRNERWYEQYYEKRRK